MAVFQHPHLTRGVVMTPKGAFVISRGFVSAPDEIGDALGWRRVDGEVRLPQDAAAPIGRRDSSVSLASMPLDRR
jgi:hypothetical protein